jgi:hypothetical protein
MNYIWEAVTKERLAGAALSDVSFVPAQNFSPYMEVNAAYLNEARIAADLRVEVNPFVRFHEIFASYMEPAFTAFPAYRRALFDMLTHMLLYTDKKSGYDRLAVERLFVTADIRSGVYGKEVQEDFSRVGEAGWDAIADGLSILYKTGTPTLHLYIYVTRRLFPHMIPYLKVRGDRFLLVYLGRAKDAESEAASRLCETFFLPADLKVRYYFDKHFGIFGVDETMRLGETVLV